MKNIGKRLGLLLVICLTAAVLWPLNSSIDKPALVNTEGRSFERAEVVQVLRDNRQENGSRIGDQIVLLRLADGAQETANCPNGMLFGAVCEPGMPVVAMSSRAGSLVTYTVYSYDRTLRVLGFISFFCFLLSWIGGRKGIRSVAALLSTFLLFLYLFLPLLMHGIAPVPAAMVTAGLILLLTVWLVCGWSRQAAAAAGGAFGGVFSAGLSAVVFGESAHLSGYNVGNIEALLFVEQNTAMDVGGLLFAGILFVSLGAVLDIAMDVSAAVTEIHRGRPEEDGASLFRSGMSVGRDVMGTMAATLILAVFGGSLGTWVLDYVYDLPLLQLLNSNRVDIVLMQGLSGGIGVILTVPLTSALSSWMLTHRSCSVSIKKFWKKEDHNSNYVVKYGQENL